MNEDYLQLLAKTYWCSIQPMLPRHVQGVPITSKYTEGKSSVVYRRMISKELKEEGTLWLDWRMLSCMRKQRAPPQLLVSQNKSSLRLNVTDWTHTVDWLNGALNCWNTIGVIFLYYNQWQHPVVNWSGNLGVFRVGCIFQETEQKIVGYTNFLLFIKFSTVLIPKLIIITL